MSDQQRQMDEYCKSVISIFPNPTSSSATINIG